MIGVAPSRGVKEEYLSRSTPNPQTSVSEPGNSSVRTALGKNSDHADQEDGRKEQAINVSSGLGSINYSHQGKMKMVFQEFLVVWFRPLNIYHYNLPGTCPFPMHFL